MARRRTKRKSSHRRKGGHCKVVSVGGHRRRLCWSKKGKLKSNTAVHAKRRRRSRR
jgi:hypothetical protein